MDAALPKTYTHLDDTHGQRRASEEKQVGGRTRPGTGGMLAAKVRDAKGFGDLLEVCLRKDLSEQDVVSIYRKVAALVKVNARDRQAVKQLMDNLACRSWKPLAHKT